MVLSVEFPSDWIIEARPWEWATIALVAILAAGWLYGWNARIARGSTGSGLRPAGRGLLGLLRFLTFFGLGALLLEPLIRSESYEEEKPIVVLLMDESASVLARSDSAQTAQQLNAWTAAFSQAVSDADWDFEPFGFSDELKPLAPDSAFSWSGAQTNLHQSLLSLSHRIENRNIAGIVLASDGLINRGASPVYGIEWPNIPVWTIGLGDTSLVRDRWIQRINHNRIAYLGNTFPMELFIESQGMKGTSGSVEIRHNNAVIASESWTEGSAAEIQKFQFTLAAEETGMQRYEVRIVPTEGEFDLNNNRRNFYVEVLESRKKIVCISAHPHPDMGALQMALSELDTYDIEAYNLSKLTDSGAVTRALESADVVIAHDLLGKKWKGLAWTKLIGMNEVPVWWIASEEGSWKYLQAPNELGVLMTNSGDLQQTHRARMNPGFAALEFTPDLDPAMRNWPPIQGPFEQTTWSPAWSPLALRQFGDVETNDAFWGVRTESSGIRQILTIGEGIWRWRMRNFVLENEHLLFNSFIQRQVQFLAAKEGRQRLMVQCDKRISVDQRLVFSGQAYDAAWSPVRDATIELVLTDEKGQSFTRTLLESANGFECNFGRMPEGTYRWIARCTLDDTAHESSGIVIIEDTQIEQTNLAADHGTLQRISERTGGSFLGTFMKAREQNFAETIAQNGIPPTIRHQQTTLREAVDWWVWMLAVLAFLTVEWVIRRRNLGY